MKLIKNEGKDPDREGVKGSFWTVLPYKIFL